ncbi:oligosaccharide flippase family protein [bacterium]|nr:oligosaccharide flippase family protein [bacterium]
MLRTQSVISDGLWVLTLQVLSAVGQLIGIRLLTSTLSPTIFGEVSLLIGIIGLVAGALINPTMQALLRFYPEYQRNNQVHLLNKAINHHLRKLAILAVPLMVVAVLLSLYIGWPSSVDLALLAVLIGVEMIRMRSTAVLNAVRYHRIYGLWSLVESWGKPAFASLLVILLQAPSSQVVLFAYLCVSLFALLIFKNYLPSVEPSIKNVPKELKQQIWKYTLPLLPLGILGWISGTFDRYIIGFLLSPTDVGLYVAMYAVASRPMMMLSTVAENTIRPVYQRAAIEADTQKMLFYLRSWILVILIGASITLAITYYGHDLIANMLLGEQFHSVSYLMPWVVGGYTLLGLSSIPTRICYAHNRTDYVLSIVVVGSVTSVVLGYIATYYWGLLGSAVVTPVYFGMQFLVATVLSAHIWSLLLSRKDSREDS